MPPRHAAHRPKARDARSSTMSINLRSLRTRFVFQASVLGLLLVALGSWASSVLGENLHAGIEKPNELTAEPDEQRCVEQAVLSHVKVAVPGDDPGLRVPSGPKQPPQT
jgi:hypothetical protein